MPRIIAIVGPTAVGKSTVAVELAQSLEAEIVSCDSMQVYRQMPVLSQGPTRGQRVQVPHYLIECVEPTQAFSVGEYRKRALPAITQILGRGRRVLIVGGTGLYLKALTDGLCQAPPADVSIRERLWSECQGLGSPTLYDRLRGVDAAAASRIHPHDARRIIRALEVYTLTGRPISSWWRQACEELLPAQVTIIGLGRDREALYQRIDERLLHMVYEEGVINEARRVLGLPLSRTARQVHGLADLERYLSGDVSLKETIRVWQQRVRNYARRQLTWFRRTPQIQWLVLHAQEPPWETAARVLECLRSPQPHPLPVFTP
ncbi:MAG: tRNA (adenosine(37)-N6)-dimethylallyltransferase MiaA [Candidatus Omnitrophota bacterium]|nr:tRNA (adenosine(37)-N6)-dimethylallyltransferase MiaA [Candidatus Omnitrophota bacterium]